MKKKKLGRPFDVNVRKTSRKAYKLRLQNKSWREIAEATGVLKSYERGNFLIEFQTRNFAKRHNLPWPPASTGENA